MYSATLTCTENATIHQAAPTSHIDISAGALVGQSVAVTGGGAQRSLFRFEMAGVKSYWILRSAVLTINCISGDALATLACTRRITQVGDPPNYDNITWNNYATGISWDVAGGTIAQSSWVNAVSKALPTGTGAYTIDCLGHIKDARLAGAGVIDLMIKLADDTGTTVVASVFDSIASGTDATIVIGYDLPVADNVLRHSRAIS